jgi:hypothetical protein
MRATEPLRLALVGLLFILLQLAFYTAFPQWRAGVDIYVAFLLLVTATRGPLMSGIYAVGGALPMDALSGEFPVFHMFYYLLPVVLGAVLRSYMLVEFKLLGALTVLGLLLLKIILLFIVGATEGKLDSPVYLLQVNYLPMLFLTGLVLLAWPWMIRVIPTTREVRRIGF